MQEVPHDLPKVLKCVLQRGDLEALIALEREVSLRAGHRKFELEMKAAVTLALQDSMIFEQVDFGAASHDEFWQFRQPRRMLNDPNVS
jgi:hypothetical protein